MSVTVILHHWWRGSVFIRVSEKVEIEIKMSEQKYNEVFEFIKASLVPKNEVDKSKNEISRLKLALESATNDLEKLKLENVEQKLTIDIVKAENKSLESEKEHFEFKFNEVSLKLKQKTIQYDSLLKSQRDDCESHSESRSESRDEFCDLSRDESHDESHDESRDGSRSDSREPNPIEKFLIGAVIADYVFNIPSSSSEDESESDSDEEGSDSPKTDAQRTTAQRMKHTIFNSISRITRKSTKKFSCADCIDKWGELIESDYRGNPDKIGAPDPRQLIKTFSSFKDYRHHLSQAHNGHAQTNGEWPHGDIKCKKCHLTFKVQHHHDEHFECEHADLNRLSNKEIYGLFCNYNFPFPIFRKK